MLDEATIREIAGLPPNLRVIYSLRNPIARAWSSALMSLERAEMTIDEASPLWFLDHFKSAGPRRRGDSTDLHKEMAETIFDDLFDHIIKTRPASSLYFVATSVWMQTGSVRFVLQSWRCRFSPALAMICRSRCSLFLGSRNR
jgi:hypothetical protein